MYIGKEYNPLGGYTIEQINKKWIEMEKEATKQYIRNGQMLPCPKSCGNTLNCTAIDMTKWRKYGGNPNNFHCGFTGFMEIRIAGENNNPAPTNECFYDHQGNLVDENHKYKGCRGTPDYYPFYGDTASYILRGFQHLSDSDSGGPQGPSLVYNKNGKLLYSTLGEEAKSETERYFRENPAYRPK